MRKNFGVKTWTYPQPVFIIGTYDEKGVPNAMNAAWGGISDDDQISICVGENHKTTANLLQRKAFTVSIGCAEQRVACDYVGLVSGKDVPDKLERAGFHAVASSFVDAPLFAELPMALECRLVSYDLDSCRLVGEIINVSAEERILNEAGEIDLEKLQPLTYDPIHRIYYGLGSRVGHAFQDGKEIK